MIVLAAATAWEAGPLARRWGLEARGGLWSGRAAGRDIILVETGVGPAKAAGALARLGSNGGPALAPPLAVISTGFAGALRPGLGSGHIVADLRGTPDAPGAADAARRAAGEAGVALALGTCVSSGRALCLPAEKLELGAAAGALAVDMESDAVRAWAAGRPGCAAMALRVVLDEAGQPLPAWVSCFDGARSARQGLSAFAAWKAPALEKAAAVPAMVLLGWRQAAAMSALGRFLDRFLDLWGRNEEL